MSNLTMGLSNARTRCSIRPLLALVGLLAMAAPASAERRVALIIGNAAYEHTAPLQNSVNDATAMRELFVKAGFEAVETRTDLGAAAMRRALADFQTEAQDADIAIVYYSGHGIEVDGQNYLVPIDAEVKRSVDVQDEAVSLKRVLGAVQGAKRLKMVILDACRNDPFNARSLTRSVSRGLARTEPEGTNELIAYSAKAGTLATDGDTGGHSPYTEALVKHLTTPGLDVTLSLRRVRDEVLQSTHGEQEPFFYGSVGGSELPLSDEEADVKVASLVQTKAQEKTEPRIPVKTSNSVVPRVEAKVQESVAPRVEQKAPVPVESRIVVASRPPLDRQAAPTAVLTDATVGECDRLAASPLDPQRPAGVPGIRTELVDGRIAVPVCRSAHAADPANQRITFELGRAMFSVGDDSEAAHYYRLAADAGYSSGMNYLGVLYRKGLGVLRDDSEAVLWFRRAADAGLPVAMANLAAHYANGRGVGRDDAEAARWYRRSANAGFGAAMVKLGRMYEFGIGVPRNPAQAERLYTKARKIASETAKLRQEIGPKSPSRPAETAEELDETQARPSAPQTINVPQTSAPFDADANRKSCSVRADALNLHGVARSDFRTRCLRGS